MINLHLDVDGVINADFPDRGGWSLDGARDGHAEAGGRYYKIMWSQDMVDHLFSLGMNLFWTTTWQDHAVSAIAPLIGHGHEGAVVYNPDPSRYRHAWSIEWKFDAMQELYPEGNTQPFVWIDDEIGYPQRLWAESRGGIAIATDPMVGISKSNMQLIEDYISSVNSSDSSPNSEASSAL